MSKLDVLCCLKPSAQESVVQGSSCAAKLGLMLMTAGWILWWVFSCYGHVPLTLLVTLVGVFMGTRLLDGMPKFMCAVTTFQSPMWILFAIPTHYMCMAVEGLAICYCCEHQSPNIFSYFHGSAILYFVVFTSCFRAVIFRALMPVEWKSPERKSSMSKILY
ncbi:MAG: hypothetical protein K2X81_03085 [Candidatus Obscuribacterales bacterium]|nr:hypothetical protein [Candidatus Obscuribacterales bacterium]